MGERGTKAWAPASSVAKARATAFILFVIGATRGACFSVWEGVYEKKKEG